MNRVINSAGKLIEWLGYHHAPMHEDGGVDEISITELSGTKTCVFHVNAFNLPAPGTDWTPGWYGVLLGAGKTAKICWLPLNFLKQGDIIVSYTVGVRVVESGGDTVTLDCALIRTNEAATPTKTSITNGAITQITADGYSQATANPDDETVATEKQYSLEITGTTSNVGGSEKIYIFGAEVTVTRLM